MYACIMEMDWIGRGSIDLISWVGKFRTKVEQNCEQDGEVVCGMNKAGQSVSETVKKT